MHSPHIPPFFMVLADGVGTTIQLGTQIFGKVWYHYCDGASGYICEEWFVQHTGYFNAVKENYHYI